VDERVFQDMMPFKVIVALFLCSCAQTRIYDSGQLLAVIQGDCMNVTVKGGTTYFHAYTLNHSAATAAAYNGSTAVIGAVASGVVSGIVAFPK